MSSMNVVVVSNRVARAKPDEPLAGGLAAALLPMVRDSGAIWVGSSGQETATTQTHDSFAKIDALMGRALQRFNSPEAVFWVQDYHFLTLGAELRQQGIERPLGFFLHTPWADRRTMSAVPHCNDLAEAMLAYDLIGFQTVEDRQNFEDFLRTELSLNIVDGTVASHWGLTQLATFPIGIDVDDFAARASKSVTRPEVTRLRESLHGAKLVLGVDRLDYSKGLANRVRAFDRMLEIEPGLKRHVSLLQVAVPSRGNIKAYRELKSELAGLVGEVNGRHGEVDWSPIRYLNKGFSQLTLAGFYRVAGVGLVTPLHDGMNLVAKEYVAAQNPLDPGVLVLSSFAGAAKELDAALLVNPHDIDGMARQIAIALAMRVEERRERWQQMVVKLRRASVRNWFTDFLHTLAEVRRAPAIPANLPQVLDLAQRSAAQ